MAISFVAVGSYAASGVSPISPGLPAGIAAGDLLILTVCGKYDTINITTPSGWTAHAPFTGGAGTSGNDVGTLFQRQYTLEYTGSESAPSVAFTTGNVVQAQIVALRKGSTETWSVVSAKGGGDTNADSNSTTITCGSTGTYQVGDWLQLSTGFPGNVFTTITTRNFSGVNSSGGVVNRNFNQTSAGTDGSLDVNTLEITGANTATFAWTTVVTSGVNTSSVGTVLQIRAVAGTTPIGKSLQFIWNTAAVISDTLELRWNTLVNMTAIGKELQYLWNVRSVLAKDLQEIWNTRQAAGKSLQEIWNIRSATFDTLDIPWNTRSFAGKSLDNQWNVRAAQGKESQFLWNTRSPVGKEVQYLWNTLVTGATAIGKDLGLLWSINALIAKELQQIWNIRAVVADEQQYLWNVRTVIGDEQQYLWNVRQAIGDQQQYLWNIRAIVADSLDVRWNVLSSIGDPLDIRWNVLAALGKQQQYLWNVNSVVRALARGANIISGWNTTFNSDVSGWAVDPGDVATTISWSSGALRITTASDTSYIEAYSTVSSVPVSGLVVYRFRARADHSTVGFFQVMTGGGWTPFDVTTAWQTFEIFINLTGPSFDTIWLGCNAFEVAGSWIEFDDIEIRAVGDLALLWNVLTNAQAIGKELQVLWNTRQIVRDVQLSNLLTSWGLDFASGIANFEGGGNVLVENDNGALRLTRQNTTGALLGINWNASDISPLSNGPIVISMYAWASAPTDVYFWLYGSASVQDNEAQWTVTTERRRYEFVQYFGDQGFNRIELGAATSVPAGRQLWFDEIEVHYVDTTDLTLRWNTLTRLADSLQLRWHTLISAANQLDTRWNVKSLVGKAADVRWNIRQILGDELFFVWTTRTVFNKDLSLRWNVLTVVPGKNLGIVWHIKQTVGEDLTLYWEVFWEFIWVPVNPDSEIWTPINPDSEIWSAVGPDSELWSYVDPNELHIDNLTITDSADSLTGWSGFFSTASVVVSGERVKEGAASLKVTWTTQAAFGCALIKEFTGLVPGRRYRAVAWVNVPNGMPTVYLGGFFMPYQQIRQISRQKDVWEEVVTEFIPDASNKKLSIQNWDASVNGQYAYVDDIRIYEISHTESTSWLPAIPDSETWLT